MLQKQEQKIILIANENKYTMIKEIVEIEGREYVTYGIKCDTDTVHDISTDYGFVKSIIMALNENFVSDIHLRDVVEDYLATYY